MRRVVKGAHNAHVTTYVSQRTGLPKTVVSRVLAALPGAFHALLSEYGMVTIRGVATFRVRCRNTWRTPSGYETKLELTPALALKKIGAMVGANEDPALLEKIREREAGRMEAAAQNSLRWRQKDAAAAAKQKAWVKEWVQQVLKDVAKVELPPEAIPDIPDPPRPPKIIIDPVTGEKKEVPHWRDRSEEYHRKRLAGEVVPDRPFE